MRRRFDPRSVLPNEEVGERRETTPGKLGLELKPYTQSRREILCNNALTTAPTRKEKDDAASFPMISSSFHPGKKFRPFLFPVSSFFPPGEERCRGLFFVLSSSFYLVRTSAGVNASSGFCPWDSFTPSPVK